MQNDYIFLFSFIFAFFIKRARLPYRHRVVVLTRTLFYGWTHGRRVGAVVNYRNQMHRDVHEKYNKKSRYISIPPNYL